MEKKKFHKLVLDYYKQHGRHTLPWRTRINPYSVLVSEIMLQQTQVDRVTPKYKTFLKKFPSFRSLARADMADVLIMWKGLGYNNRAVRLWKTAKIVTEDFGGTMPKQQSGLESLPGIGHYTASAIRCFAWNEPVVCIETNIRRVFLHHFFQGKDSVSDKELLSVIELMLYKKDPRIWYWALMDYGAFLKTQIENPNKKSKHYAKQSKFEGSDRQIRGRILDILLAKKKSISMASLVSLLHIENLRLEKILKTMIKDDLVVVKKEKVSLK
jgi:A/G-specific adenine glycosylase